MLWEADFVYLRYRYVDLLHGAAAPADGRQREGATSPASEVERATQRRSRSRTRRAIVNMSDFDATLYFLDEREIEYLQSEIEREYAHDLAHERRRRCCSTSSRRRTTAAVREEVIEHARHADGATCSPAGHFRGVAHLLREVAGDVDARAGAHAGARRAARASSRCGSARPKRSRSCCSRSTTRRSCRRRTELMRAVRSAAADGARPRCFSG